MASVVLGHAIQRNLGPDVRSFIFLAAFEMPLFAFVSGYLARPPRSDTASWLGSRALRLLVPFVAWAPVLWFMSRFSFTGLDVVEIPVRLADYARVLFARPEDGLWYLLVLFEWCVALAIMSFLLGVDRPLYFRLFGVALSTGVVAAVLVGLASASHTGDFGLSFFLSLAPFFMAGYVLRELDFDLSLKRPTRWSAVGAVLLALLGASILLLPDVGRYSPALSLAQGILGVTAAVLLLMGLGEDAVLSALSYVGRSSFGVYALHLFFLRAGVGNGWVKVLTSFALAIGLSLLGTSLLRSTRPTAFVLLGERNQRKVGRSLREPAA